MNYKIHIKEREELTIRELNNETSPSLFTTYVS